MDLKAHYQKIREVEQSFKEPYPVVVSQETPDGGIAGVKTEVPASLAAKMIVEGHARAANEQETAEFRAQNVEAKQIADSIEASQRMQITVLPQSSTRPRRKTKPATES